MKLLNFKKENSLFRRGYKIVVGVDEAGRGSLAGPITAAAAAVIGPISNPQFLISKPRTAGQSSPRGKQRGNLRFLKDSKKLSPKKREEFYGILTREPRIFWATASVGPKMIDRINVARAANLAARRAFLKLIFKIQSAEVPARPPRNFGKGNSLGRFEIFALLDGSLSLPAGFEQETITGGDEKIWSIAAASVVAKVTRDRVMRRLAEKFPAYGLEIHKGYGTKSHYRRIEKFGPAEIHRGSFLKNSQSRRH